MKPLPHHYSVRLAGAPAGDAQLFAVNRPVLRAAPPVEYDGPGDEWSPEHLLLAAVQSCFLFTLRAVARLSKVEFASLEVETEGTVDRQEGVTRFTEIVVRPTMTVPLGTDRARALAALQRAEKACLVSASLATPIRLEAEIIQADVPTRARAVG
ncbi:MAG TPA: OsmC family protein [Vicinamibacterales bacterium]